MRATWWWIDRWRKSTAYTDMTLEEQGAYRNLCDEVVLRDDGVIPETSLGRAAGDAAAWERVSVRVLQWMRKVPGGWTNDTALEVKAKSAQLSKKQSDRAKSGWSKRCRKDAAVSAAAMPQSMHETMPPSPSPDMKERITERIAAPSALAVVRKPKAWSVEACDDWIAAYHGTAPGGRIGKALAPLVKNEGWESVRTAWRSYLAQTEAEYASPQRFAATFGRWSGSAPAVVPRIGGKPSVVDQTKAVLEKFVREG